MRREKKTRKKWIKSCKLLTLVRTTLLNVFVNVPSVRCIGCPTFKSHFTLFTFLRAFKHWWIICVRFSFAYSFGKKKDENQIRRLRISTAIWELIGNQFNVRSFRVIFFLRNWSALHEHVAHCHSTTKTTATDRKSRRKNSCKSIIFTPDRNTCGSHTVLLCLCVYDCMNRIHQALSMPSY